MRLSPILASAITIVRLYLHCSEDQATGGLKLNYDLLITLLVSEFKLFES